MWLRPGRVARIYDRVQEEGGEPGEDEEGVDVHVDLKLFPEQIPSPFIAECGLIASPMRRSELTK